jgi:hypothetical protein
MSSLTQADLKKEHASCDVASSLGVLSNTLDYLSKPPTLLEMLLNGMNYNFPQYRQLKDNRTQKVAKLTQQLDLITSVNCTDECAKCVWGDRLDCYQFEETADIVSKMLELDEDKLNIASTIRIIDEER